MFINTVTIISRLTPTTTPPIKASIILSPSFLLQLKALRIRFRSVLHRSNSMHIRAKPSQRCDLLFLFYTLALLPAQNLAEQCRCLYSITYQSLCKQHSADLSLVVSAHRLAFARHSYADPLHSVTIPEQFAPQQFPLCSQRFYRYSHHCYTLPYLSDTILRHSPSMSCLAFAFP